MAKKQQNLITDGEEPEKKSILPKKKEVPARLNNGRKTIEKKKAGHARNGLEPGTDKKFYIYESERDFER